MEDRVSGEYSIHAMDATFLHILIEKPEGNRLHGRHGRRWNNNLKIIHKEKGYERHSEHRDELSCSMKGLGFSWWAERHSSSSWVVFCPFPLSGGCLCQCFTKEVRRITAVTKAIGPWVLIETYYSVQFNSAGWTRTPSLRFSALASSSEMK